MATEQSAVATNPTAQPSAFERAFMTVLGQGSDLALNILKTRGEQVLAREQIQRDVSVQQLYNNLAQQTPNLGPNEVAPAARESVQQSQLLLGKIPLGDSQTQRFVIFAIVAVLGIWVITKILRKK